MPRRYRRNWNTTPRQRQASFGRFLRGAGTAVNVASKALSVAKGVASMINPEKKWFDTKAAATGVTTTAAINCVTAIGQGDTSVTRDGDSIKAVSLALHADLNWSAYTAKDARVRIMIIRDLIQCGGTAPVIGKILYNVTNAQELMQSFMNMNYGKRIQILYDRVFTQNDNKDDNHIQWYYKFAPTTKQVDKMSKKANPHITWLDGTATDYDFGHVFLVAVGDQTENPPTLSYITRLRFYDN